MNSTYEMKPISSKEEKLLGKNLLAMLPPRTYGEFYPEFKKVLLHRTKSVRNYELNLRNETYFFERRKVAR